MRIMVSPTGALLGKADHPAVPLSVAEIVDTAQACAAAGANALHLHVRDADGRHSLDPVIYAEALSALKQVLPDLPVQITTEAGGRYGPEAQYALLEALAPRYASIALREVGADQEMAVRIYDLCRANGTQVQHIVYDVTDADRLKSWQAKGVLGEGEDFILVLGDYAQSRRATPADLDTLRAALPPVGRWMVCAFGQDEHACLHYAASKGGDVRVGFENAIQGPDGSVWPTVETSVTHLVQRLERPG